MTSLSALSSTCRTSSSTLWSTLTLYCNGRDGLAGKQELQDAAPGVEIVIHRGPAALLKDLICEDVRIELYCEHALIASRKLKPAVEAVHELVTQCLPGAEVQVNIIKEQVYIKARARGSRSSQGQDTVHEIWVSQPLRPQDRGGRIDLKVLTHKAS